MYIVISCLGMPFNGDTIKEKSLGGSETAAYYMAKELVEQGHDVTMFTHNHQEGDYDGVHYLSAGNITENAPMGERFHFYAENTPHDVLIIQRHPRAFNRLYASKINLLWLHDLAQKETADVFRYQMWNIQGVLTVSKYHKQQILDTWGISPDVVFPIQNGIDVALYDNIGLPPDRVVKIIDQIPDSSKTLLYSSRPERGLEHLVGPGGVMEKLAEQGDDSVLIVCGYDNTVEQMRAYYEYLWGRCEELPNVINVGSLTKQELAELQGYAWATVYPTPGPHQPEFREVSCITAMENMAAGTAFISSNIGALPETCAGSASILLDVGEDGMPRIDAFVDAVKNLNNTDLGEICFQQLESAKQFCWSISAGMLEEIIYSIFDKCSDAAKLKQLVRTSDIVAARRYFEGYDSREHGNSILDRLNDEVENLYSFCWEDDFEDHYRRYYQYEADRGVDYGPETLDGNNRFESVAGIIGADTPDDALILDYGCAHGHYTINLAKRYPNKRFVGVDIAKSNIDKAKKWAEKENLENVEFFHGRVDVENDVILDFRSPRTVSKSGGEEHVVDYYDWPYDGDCDAIIAAEVLEHVADPIEVTNVLKSYLKQDGLMIITTPYGPWEAMGYRQHYPWRAHLWHFEKQDLKDIWGEFPEYRVLTATNGAVPNTGEPIGSFITTFRYSDKKPGSIDYNRKWRETWGPGTTSLCMIVKNGEDSLRRCLGSIGEEVDEVLIQLDEGSTDRTEDIIDNYEIDTKLWPTVRRYYGSSPLNVGFDAARNENIGKAAGDWIVWVDHDEIVNYGGKIRKYLAPHNGYNGYSIKQHHFAVEPLGLLKTDMPVRIFRNHKGIKFFGVVHEHPELDLNQGIGHAMILNDVDIVHTGYLNETIRRGRFDRNINLMAKDREKYPGRWLGKFLWMRDLAQMIRYDLEKGTSVLDPRIHEMAAEGVKMFEQLLDEGQVRMLVDGISFYSTCAQVVTKGEAIEASFAVDISTKIGTTKLEEAPPITATFATREHFDKFINAMINERIKR